MKKTYATQIGTLLMIGSLTLSPLISEAESACLVREPTIQISEFSFNNTVKDFIDLAVLDDGNGGGGAILDNYTLTSIDSTLKKLSGVSVRTGDHLHLDDVGNLTATTDQIVLMKNTTMIDAVCWTSSKPTVQETADFAKLETAGAWSRGISSCIDSNVTKNTSLRRKGNLDTNSTSDWEVKTDTTTTVPTAPTTTIEPITQPSATPTAVLATNEVIISEFLPDPEGSDADNEWIELKNTSDHDVSMAGWQLDDEDGGSKPYSLKNLTIGAESFVTLKNSETGITLNNTLDSVRLLTPSGTEYLKIPYAKTTTNQSWALAPDKSWKQTAYLTPREENIFDAAASATGTPLDAATNPSNTPATTDNPIVDVSEIFPNPTGTDQGKEWIELHNSISTPIALAGWKIKNGNGKSFTFPAGTIIPGNGYIVITDQVSKLSLKNSNDLVQVIDSDDQIQDTVEFENASENVSFAKISSLDLDETSSSASPASSSTLTSWVEWLIPRAEAASDSAATADSEWQWTDMITKGKPNPNLIHMQGTVTREPDATNTFTIQTPKGEMTIGYSSDKVNQNLLASTIRKGSAIDIKAYQDQNHTLKLDSFQPKKTQDATQNTPSENSSTAKIALIIFMMLLAATLAYLKYYFKKSPTLHHDSAL